MNILKRIVITAAATVFATVGALVATTDTAAAANLKVKNHQYGSNYYTAPKLYLRDSKGSYYVNPDTHINMPNGGRQAWIPQGWVLTKDSVTWRSACGGVSPYWTGFSWQATTVDIRWKKCNN